MLSFFLWWILNRACLLPFKFLFTYIFSYCRLIYFLVQFGTWYQGVGKGSYYHPIITSGFEYSIKNYLHSDIVTKFAWVTHMPSQFIFLDIVSAHLRDERFFDMTFSIWFLPLNDDLTWHAWHCTTFERWHDTTFDVWRLTWPDIHDSDFLMIARWRWWRFCDADDFWHISNTVL